MSILPTDQRFALELAQHNETAEANFRHEFRAALGQSFRSFRTRVPDCQRESESLSPHVSSVSGRGYVRLLEAGDEHFNFNQYVDSLYLTDLYHASACLDWTAWRVPEPQCDRAAVAEVEALVHNRIRPTLLNRFRNQQCVEDVAGDLPGHVLLPGQSGQLRLVTYDGRSSLVTWMMSVAFRLVLTCLRNQDRNAVGEAGQKATLEPPAVADEPTGPERASQFIRRFYPHIVELVEGIHVPERTQWLDEVCELPAREKEKYRNGLTDRQKIVFRLLYYRGLRPSDAAEILGVSRAYVSQCVRKFCERLATLAQGVIDELADEANVDRDLIVDELERLFHFLTSSEWDSDWEDISASDAAKAFLDALRRRDELSTEPGDHADEASGQNETRRV